MENEIDDAVFIPGFTGPAQQMASGQWRIQVYVDGKNLLKLGNLIAETGVDVFLVFGTPENMRQAERQELIKQAAQEDGTQPRPKGGRASMNAAMLCQNPFFQTHAANSLNNMEKAVGSRLTHDVSEETARLYIIEVCEIESRADLDHDGEARRRYNSVVFGFDRAEKARTGAIDEEGGY